MLLENVLQSKLHDPWVSCREDLTEGVAADVRCWIHLENGVGYIERLNSEFHPLRFADLEISGHRNIELPVTGATNTAPADISERTECR